MNVRLGGCGAPGARVAGRSKHRLVAHDVSNCILWVSAGMESVWRGVQRVSLARLAVT